MYLFSVQLLGGLQRSLVMPTYSCFFTQISKQKVCSEKLQTNVMVLMFGCDVRIPPHLTLQSWKSSHIATAAVKRWIPSHAAVLSAAAHPGEPRSSACCRTRKPSVSKSWLFSQLLIFAYNPQRAKRLWQYGRSQLEKKCRRSLEVCNGGKRDLAVRRAAVPTWFGAARSRPKSSPPCPGWEKHPPLEDHGNTAPLRHGTARGGERGPGCWVWRCRSTRTSGAPTATVGGGCERGPAPLVLPQLYYGGLSVGLIDIEPECTVQRLSVNYMWLSIYCFDHDLGLKKMNLLLVKTGSITFSWHR